jgi:hypothetical protein
MSDDVIGKLIEGQRRRERELRIRLEELRWVLDYGGQDFDRRIEKRIEKYERRLKVEQEYGD